TTDLSELILDCGEACEHKPAATPLQLHPNRKSIRIKDEFRYFWRLSVPRCLAGERKSQINLGQSKKYADHRQVVVLGRWSACSAQVDFAGSTGRRGS